MFDTALRTALPTMASAVLDRARAARAAELAAAADLLVAAAEWGELHPCPPDEAPAGWGTPDLHGEGVVPLAGDGAPLVAEFAPLTLAAHLGLGPDAGRALLGDALELKHRLPRTWRRVLDHDLPAWRARQLAQRTAALSLEQAAKVDRWVRDERPGWFTPRRIALLVDEIVLYDDPDRAADDERRAAETRFVRLDHHAGAAGTTDLRAVLDTEDALALDAALDDVAGLLAYLGDTADRDVRRARAVGVLADPQRALDLASGGGAGSDTAPVALPSRSAEVTLYAHLDPHGVGAAVEGLGAVTTGRFRQWLDDLAGRGAHVVVRPLLDLADPETLTRAVDAHDPPAWMREAAVLRDHVCVFPGCERTSRSADLDHVEPYVPLDQGGEPGQTRLDNLASC